MKAEEASFVVNLVQSGASGGEYVLAGSVSVSHHDSDTLALLGNTAHVTGRNARIYAGDLATNVNWVGGVAVGESLGIGLSVAVNEINRTTRAIIGEPDANDPVPTGTPNIDFTDNVELLARVDGDLWSFTIAGAVAANAGTGGAFAIAGAAAASFNRIDSETVASLGSSSVHAGEKLTVTATDAAQIVGIAGGGGCTSAGLRSGAP